MTVPSLYLRYITIVLCLLQIAMPECKAQLKINDTCPDIKFSSTINWHKPPMQLSDFSGKALIIDFWSTWCSSCIESFPVIDSLQKKFKDSIQFILVTKQDRKTIENFFLRFKKIKAPNIPLVTDDTQLSALFPSDGYPYIIWMDKNRIVSYFTHAYSMTQEHFEKFLNGIKLNVKPAGKKTVYTPLWKVEDSIFMMHVKYYSALTSCIDNVDTYVPQTQPLNQGECVQISYSCSSLLTLIRKAFGENGKYKVDTRYGIEINIDSTMLIRPVDPNKQDEWDKDHLFNYQLILSIAQKDLLYKIMQDDLQRYFNISITRIKKKVKGYVLTNLNGKPVPASTKKASFDTYIDGDIANADTLHFTNQSWERLNKLLNFWIHNSFPFKNLAHGQERIDFTIRKTSIEPLNIQELNKDLSSLNLKLEEEQIETDVVIIGRKNKSWY